VEVYTRESQESKKRERRKTLGRKKKKKRKIHSYKDVASLRRGGS
jgi:hypothetical protein